MAPKKPRQSEPGLPPSTPTAAQTRKGRTSLPALPRSSLVKQPVKRKAAVIESREDKAPASAKAAKPKVVLPVKKKIKLDVGVEAEEEEAEEEEEDEEIEEMVEKPPVKRSAKSTVKEIAKAAAPKTTAPAKTKNARRESSKGEDKIGEIYAAGSELLSDKSVAKRSETITVLVDKLEKQLHIPMEQLMTLCNDRAIFYDTVIALSGPIKATFEDRAALQKSLNDTITRYGTLPKDAQEIVSTLEKAHKAAVESGLKHIEDSQDFTHFTRNARRFIAWNR